MRRTFTAVVLVALLVAVSACRHAVPAHGGARGGAHGPEIGPLVAGTTSYVDGTFAWTDYVLDDRGPNLVEVGVLGPPRCSFPGAPDCSGGDAQYPLSAAPGNAADLVQLQLGRDRGRGLSVRAVLGSLVDPDVPVLGVAFDTDADSATGAATLPGGRWPSVNPLGVDTLIVGSDAGGELWRYSDAWTGPETQPGGVRADVDPAANTIDLAAHERLLPAMTGQWRAFAVLGVRSESGGSWLDGSGEIFDLAFVGSEPFVQWQDARQGDILAGPRAPTHDGLSSTAAAAVIDWTKVRSRTTELADATSPGFHTYLFRSSLDLPEGVTNPNPSVSTQHEYLGRHQPYLVYIPEELPAGNPLTVWLHGANNNHMQSIFEQDLYVGTARAGSEDFFLIERFQPDALINIGFPKTIQICVLGRGETLGYAGISEIDVLEATDDAIRRFDIDPDRVTLSGASMGGIGSYRLGTLHPDRWAAVVPVIGTGVYWVSGIDVGGEAAGTVDVTSNAIPHTDEHVVRSTTVDGNTTEGRDLCGPNPAFAPGWSPAHPAGETWTRRSLERLPGAPQPLSNTLDASFTNVAAVSLDLERAGIDAGEGFTLRVETDRDVALTLTGMGRRTVVSLDDVQTTRADQHGRAVVFVPAGRATVAAS